MAQEKDQPKLWKQGGKSPVKVFILAGQSNMLGYGLVSEKDKSGKELKGTLVSMLKDSTKAPLIKLLFDPRGTPAVRDDVWVDNADNWPKTTARGLLSLSFGCNKDNFGPELGFGQVLFVETHDFGRPKEESPGPWEPHHEYRNAETYYLVGEALGQGMKTLLGKTPNKGASSG